MIRVVPFNCEGQENRIELSAEGTIKPQAGFLKICASQRKHFLNFVLRE